MTRSVLVLGGTAWLGAEIARHAVRRGWEVTCLARGESGAVPEGARLVVADRAQPGAYAGVADRRYDAVVEVSWQPRFVQEAVEALGGLADHWTYVSTVSVYSADHAPNSEDSPRLAALDLDTEATIAHYGQAKVRCEDVTTRELGAHALIARPGLIVGPGDPTDRFGYWPGRAALAADGPMLVPRDAAPTQSIDVRDLAGWILDAGERGVRGAVNAVGEQVPFGELIEKARAVGGHAGAVHEATTPWLTTRHVAAWSGPTSLPMWVPPGDFPQIGAHASGRYRETGGMWRPLEESMRDALAWERSLGLDRSRKAGLSRTEELGLIAQLL